MADQEQKVINLHKFQDQAVFAPERFIAIIAGLQSGKTVSGCIWSRIQFDTHHQDDGLIVAPTYKILVQSTLPKFFQLNPDLLKFYKKSDNVIEVPGRGKIYIRSTENPNVLEGMTLRWAWMDEGGQMKLQAWVNIQGRLSILQGRCFITTTPYNLGWLFTDFYEQVRLGNKDYRLVQFRSIDSPYFPKEEFERVKSTMDKRTFERRYMGLFTKMEGLVYDDFHFDTHATSVLPATFDQVIAGLDWGFTAPTAIAVIGIKDNIYYLIDEYYQPGKTTPQLLEVAHNLIDKHNISRFYADSAEPDRIKEFNDGGVYTIEANKDVSLGVDKVRTAIREQRFKVSKSCQHFLDEIERYHYPERQEGKEEDEVPEKVDDHIMDALRYAIYSHHLPPKRKKKKRQLGYHRSISYSSI